MDVRSPPPPLYIPTELHKAIFNGRFEKFQTLIAEGHNIYETTDREETLLAVAIKRKHTEIATILIDKLEEDLQVVEAFFLSLEIENKFWLRERILIAFGQEHVNIVKEMSADLQVLDPKTMMDKKKHGLIVILKETGTSAAEVMWLTSCRSKDDDLKLAKIIDYIYSDGCIDSLKRDCYSNTITGSSAHYKNVDLCFRLMGIFDAGNHYKKNAYLYMFTLLCAGEENQVDKFKELMKRLSKFEIREAFSNDWTELNYPIARQQYDIFEYFLEEMGRKFLARLPPNTTVSIEGATSFVLNAFLQKSANIYRLPIAPDLVGLAEISIRLNAGLLVKHSIGETPLHAFVQGPTPCLALADYIIEHVIEIEEKLFLDDIIKRLIANNWYDVIKRIYEKCPTAKKVLFRSHYVGISQLCLSIQLNHVELASFLIDEHKDIFIDIDVNNLIIMSSKLTKSVDILKKLLTLPNANPCKVGYGMDFNSPFVAALRMQKVANFHILFDATPSKADIAGKYTDFFKVTIRGNKFGTTFESLFNQKIVVLNSKSKI